MFGSEVLEVGIGMALLFLFMSLIATALREVAEAVMKSRAKDLERGITQLLNDPNNAGLISDFYKHPLIFPLYKGDYKSGTRTLPSYIPRETFALALLDIAAKASESGSPLSMELLRGTLTAKRSPTAIDRVILTALDAARDDLNALRASIEQWYDGSMDRVSGWYKRRTSAILGVIGLVSAIAFNVDAITVAQRLIQDKVLRQSVVAQAHLYMEAADGRRAPAANSNAPASEAGDSQQSQGPGDVLVLRNKLEQVGFPIGWRLQDGWAYPAPQACTAMADRSPTNEPRYTCKSWSYWFFPTIFGWIITALAMMLGAPFWFDVLNKFMVIRSTVKPKEKSPDEASEDGQTGRSRTTGTSSSQAK